MVWAEGILWACLGWEDVVSRAWIQRVYVYGVKIALMYMATWWRKRTRLHIL